MIGIYRYRNKVNDKNYIGQSVDIKHRLYSHASAAYNQNVHEYNSKLSIAIREFGIDNFEITILKEVSSEEYKANSNILNKLERYYIKLYNSFLDGYNATPGGSTFPKITATRKGEKNGRAIMTEAQVKEIRQLWANKTPYREAFQIWKDKCSSEKCFQKIWRWDTWKDVCAELKTEDLVKWHATRSKSLAHDMVHNSILTETEIAQIKKESCNYKSVVDYYKNNFWIQQKMSLSGFRKTWNSYIK